MIDIVEVLRNEAETMRGADDVACGLCEEAAAEIERLRAIEERILSVAEYTRATLQSAMNPNHGDAEWGHVHRGRASSSIRQLEALLKTAEEVVL